MIYEVKFEHGQSNMFFSSKEKFSFRDKVLARTKSNTIVAQIVREVDESGDDFPIEGEIISILSEKDKEELEQIIIDSKEAKKLVKKYVSKHNLGMKIVEATFTFDRKQLFVSFVAEHRVDFRALLKDLAEQFKVRIELRQIGVRDAAKIFGGLGPCGRPLCCSNFIGDFPVVSIKMAKNQALTLNQSKLSGLCGRLMCCLSFEDEVYREAKKAFPDYGQILESPEGTGKVIGMNILQNTVKLRLQGSESKQVKDFALAEVEAING